MSVKLSRLLAVIICLLGIGGVAGLGLSLKDRRSQTQQGSEIEQANNLFNQKQYSQAVVAYDRLLQTDMDRSFALWTNRGYALSALNQYRQALESCTKATSLKPRAAFAWNCRGEALYRLNKPDDALEAFDKAISLNSNRAVFWLNQSQVLIDLGQFKPAVTAAQKAIALLQSQSQTPDTSASLAMAWQTQGYSLLGLEQNRESLGAFDKALEYQPENLSAYQGRGIALYRLGQYQKAIAIFTKVLEGDLTKEQQAINWLYQGISLCQTSQISLAKSAFERVLKLTENSEAQKIASAGCGIR